MAGKVARKLRVVEHGVDGLLWAMGVLFVFFVLFAATTATVEPTSSPAPSSQPAENQTLPVPAGAK